MYSQKESANWYFGDYAGLNFNDSTPVVLLDGELSSGEGMCHHIRLQWKPFILYRWGNSLG